MSLPGDDGNTTDGSAASRGRPAFSPSRRLSTIGFLCVGIIAIGATLLALDRRDAVYASYRRELGNLGVTLAEQSTRSVQAVDLVLRETQAEIQAEGIASPAQFRQALGGEPMHAFLARRSHNLPQARVISLVGADGELLAGSRLWPAPTTNLANRDWFQYLRDHDDPHLFVSQPVHAEPMGAWTFFLARRIDGPNHEFLGAVVASIEAAYFESFYDAISLHRDGSISLANRDGTMLARYPDAENYIGKRIPAGSQWFAEVAKSGGGNAHAAGFVDGIARLTSVHPLREYPLVLTVTVGERAVLAEWYRQAAFIAGCAFCMAVGAIVLFNALAAGARRLEQHTAELGDMAGALSNSEARFRDFALVSSDWFWETDENHRFAFVSDGIRGSGQEPSWYVGRSRVEVAAPSDRDQQKWDEHVAMLNRHEPFRNFHYATKPADQPERWVSVSGKPFFDSAGHFLGYRGTGRDVTEEAKDERRLYEAKAAAEAANYAKTQFLANVSHELRTPLNAILGFSEMLELGIVGPMTPKQQEYVELIRQSGNHLHDVINDILDFAKVDAGKLDLHDDHGIDPRRIVNACFAIIKERAKLGGLKLTAQFADPLPYLVVDEMRLKQVLLNLLSNAIKFTDPGGSVVASVSRTADGGVAFAVRDTGTGMTDAEIAVAMEPFGQVDGGLARRHEGTGLGLPLARRLTELHNGTLKVESEKGAGTVVTVLLPASRVLDQDKLDAYTPGAAAA